jgi:hypothetical protein
VNQPQPPPPTPPADEGAATPVWRRWWFIAMVIVAAAAAVVAVSDDAADQAATGDTTAPAATTTPDDAGTGAADTDDTTTTTGDPEPATTVPTGPLTVGDTAEIGAGSVARLRAVTPGAEPHNEFAGPADGSTITRLDVEMCAGTRPLNTNPLYWAGQDAEHRTYTPLLGAPGFQTLNLDPGGCQRGTVDLEVPDGVVVTQVVLLTAGLTEAARWSTEGTAGDLDPLTPTVEPYGVPVGTTVAVSGGAQATVHGVTVNAAPFDAFLAPPAGSSLTRLDVEVCAGGTGRPANPLYWYGVLDDHRVVSAEPGAPGFVTRELAPGTCERGTVDLAVPDGATLVAVLHTSPISDVEGRWLVNG